VVSPDGANVYAIGQGDDAIAEFSVGGGGALTWIGCIADLDADGSCDNTSATGLVTPQAIAISPDGNNVYVAAKDDQGNGDIAEFTRNADGSLTPVADNDCIAENQEEEEGCDTQGAHGLGFPVALAATDDNVYVADEDNDAVTTLTRDAADGSLSEPGGAADCIQDDNEGGNECSNTASGISEVTGIVVSSDGENVYSAGPSGGGAGSIAEFSVGTGGGLTPIGCLGTTEDEEIESCSGGATGVVGITGLAVSPDGQNVYTASEQELGPIAEFSRGAGGTLAQLPSPNNCIEEQGSDFGCGTQGIGIEDGFRLVVSPDNADVYAAAPTNACAIADSCTDVAEFARDTSTNGSLSQLASPDSCVQDSSVEGSECPGNEEGSGLGGPGIAISPVGGTVYVAGTDDIAEFSRTPVTHTLSVTLAGSGNGAVSDGTGTIHCPSACSNAYTANTQVTLTATPGSGSTFAGWGGACAGTGTCQVKMSDDMAVTATFTANASPPSPGAPTPVLTGAPSAVTDGGADFSGSVNPDGLPTTVYFQYGLDKRYSQVGASGPNYTQQTPGQTVGADFVTHGVGPVTVAGLLPNALYHVRIVATNSAGTVFGQDVSFFTATSPAPSAPVLGETFNIAPVSGLVFVLINGQLVPLTELEQIPSGTIIDALHGTFQLVIDAGGGPATDAAAKGRIQRGDFGGGVVRLHQATLGADRGLTTLMMTESAFKGAPRQAICNAPGAAADASAAKVSSKVIQLLHASAHGKFATSGRYSAATVRGTVWTIIARCDGTLVRDIKDEVVVTDFVRHKTVVLHAGQSYLAPGPRKK
jgi:DNA-binding beta-propeller fold protein YncE